MRINKIFLGALVSFCVLNQTGCAELPKTIQNDHKLTIEVATNDNPASTYVNVNQLGSFISIVPNGANNTIAIDGVGEVPSGCDPVVSELRACVKSQQISFALLIPNTEFWNVGASWDFGGVSFAILDRVQRPYAGRYDDFVIIESVDKQGTRNQFVFGDYFGFLSIHLNVGDGERVDQLCGANNYILIRSGTGLGQSALSGGNLRGIVKGTDLEATDPGV